MSAAVVGVILRVERGTVDAGDSMQQTGCCPEKNKLQPHLFVENLSVESSLMRFGLWKKVRGNSRLHEDDGDLFHEHAGAGCQ